MTIFIVWKQFCGGLSPLPSERYIDSAYVNLDNAHKRVMEIICEEKDYTSWAERIEILDAEERRN